MVNDESRMQEVMKLILEQLVIELKKVVKALKKTMFDFSRPKHYHDWWQT